MLPWIEPIALSDTQSTYQRAIGAPVQVDYASSRLPSAPLAYLLKGVTKGERD